jgi:predicted amidohydrolase
LLLLPTAISEMLDHLGRAAAKHRLYLVVCADSIETDGKAYNTAYLLGRDGKELGRYHKVNMPLAEQSLSRGNRFPVFPTPDLGEVGMLICYDLVFPETTRCLALAGADYIFVPTLGGAAFGDGDLIARRSGFELWIISSGWSSCTVVAEGSSRPREKSWRNDGRGRSAIAGSSSLRRPGERRRLQSRNPTCAAACSANAYRSVRNS